MTKTIPIIMKLCRLCVVPLHSMLHTPCLQASMDNPEWFYRHVENHALSLDMKSNGKEENVLCCGWKG